MQLMRAHEAFFSSSMSESIARQEHALEKNSFEQFCPSYKMPKDVYIYIYIYIYIYTRDNKVRDLFL